MANSVHCFTDIMIVGWGDPSVDRGTSLVPDKMWVQLAIKAQAQHGGDESVKFDSICCTNSARSASTLSIPYLSSGFAYRLSATSSNRTRHFTPPAIFHSSYNSPFLFTINCFHIGFIDQHLFVATKAVVNPGASRERFTAIDRL